MTTERHRLEIEFCVQCKFQGRAFFLARELYDQRPDLIDEISLVPATDGSFSVRYDGSTIFDYHAEHRFPDPKEVRESMLALRGMAPTPRRH